MHPDLPDPGVKVAWSGVVTTRSPHAALMRVKTNRGRRAGWWLDTTGEAEIVVTGLPWRFEVCQQVFEEAAVDYGRALAAWWDSRCGKRTRQASRLPALQEENRR